MVKLLGPRQKKLVKALKSNQYPQGKNSLQTINRSLCCLGVACKVAEENHIPLIKNAMGCIVGMNLNDQGKVKEYFKFRKEHIELAEMNDEGMSFVDIAKHIEENPYLYFEEFA